MGHQARWIVYAIINCIISHTSTGPVYTLITGNDNDALIVSNEQVYLQLGWTQRVPCGEQWTGGTTGVIAAVWSVGSTKKKEIIRMVTDSIHGENSTSPEYDGRASFTQKFDLTLAGIIHGDSGMYTCEIITGDGNKLDHEVEVVVIDKTLPKRPAVQSVSTLLQAGEYIIQCPVYNKSITRPTTYYSIQRDARNPTDILVARFSNGSTLKKDPTFDIQSEANYSLVIKKPDAAALELLIWCHVSSDVDGVNMMSGFINATQSKPAEPTILDWILPLAFAGLGVVIILCGVMAYRRLRRKEYQRTDSDDTIRISKCPTNVEDCKEYGLKGEIGRGGLKTKSRVSASNENFSSLRLVTVAGNGDMVMFDNDAIRVMSKKYGKMMSKICVPDMDEYVAVATSKRQTGEVLVARKGGKISFLNLSDGKEEEIEGSRDHPQGKISDMDVDDMGNIYVADRDKNLIHTYDVNGSFKSTFTVGDFPQCISACDDGILYVLCRPKIKSDNRCDIEGVVIKRFKNGSRDDYDIKCPKGVNIVTTGLYSSTTSLYVLTKDEESDEEASATPDKEASAKPDKEASAKLDKEASAKPDKEASATPDKEASAKPDKKASAKPDKEASAKPDKEASAKPDKEASAKLDKEASAKLDKEASAKLDKEASAKLDKEASAKLDKEASAKLDKEASAILEFSATDGHLQRRVIDDWTGIRGMVFIRGGDELAFFDFDKVKVYANIPEDRSKEMPKKSVPL